MKKLLTRLMLALGLLVPALAAVAVTTTAPAGAAVVACNTGGFSGGWYTHPSGNWAAECTYDGNHFVFNLHKYGSNGNCFDGIADNYCAGGILDAWITNGQTVAVYAQGNTGSLPNSFGYYHTAAGSTIAWTNTWTYNWALFNGLGAYQQKHISSSSNFAYNEAAFLTTCQPCAPSLQWVGGGSVVARPKGIGPAANATGIVEVSATLNGSGTSKRIQDTQAGQPGAMVIAKVTP